MLRVLGSTEEAVLCVLGSVEAEVTAALLRVEESAVLRVEVGAGAARSEGGGYI